MYQQVNLVGNLGSDPTMQYTPSGVPYTNFFLAVNETWTGADGVRHDGTTWWRVTCWRKLAEVVAQYCTKGKMVLVIGNKIKARHWTDTKTGEVRDGLECQAETVRFLGGKQDGAEGAIPSGGIDDLESIPF